VLSSFPILLCNSSQTAHSTCRAISVIRRDSARTSAKAVRWVSTIGLHPISLAVITKPKKRRIGSALVPRRGGLSRLASSVLMEEKP
jgi:hypothetical protein